MVAHPRTRTTFLTLAFIAAITVGVGLATLVPVHTTSARAALGLAVGSYLLASIGLHRRHAQPALASYLAVAAWLVLLPSLYSALPLLSHAPPIVVK